MPGWHRNVTDQGGPMVYQQRGDPTWHLVTPLTLGAYRVMGVLVPEPSTLLLGMAALLVGALRRVPADSAAGRYR